jgi:fructose-bisphosphate aldolase class II
MPLVTLKEILAHAREKEYGVPMFGVYNVETIRAVIEAAEAEKSPVILGFAEVQGESNQNLELKASLVSRAAQLASVPVCAHFDHGLTLENCIRVMHNGFSSVMFDGSTLPYEDNIRRTHEVAHFASLFGASVEAELGHVRFGEGGTEDSPEEALTNPAQCADFVNRTGVDALAVAIGTTHGFYKSKPKLDFKRLEMIRSICSVPLVLHGGSGLSDDDFRSCIKGGISKINLYTEFVQTGKDSLANTKKDGNLDYPGLMGFSIAAMREYVSGRLRLFGSSGKA